MIAGQSRAVWVSMILALGVMLLLMEHRQRVRLAALAGGATTVLLVIGFIAFSSLFVTILEGLATRLTSLEQPPRRTSRS